MRKEIRLAGSGGQGLLLAGAILSNAMGKYEFLNVVTTNSYGPEARGGASKTELIVSTDVIDYPKTEAIDILLVMSPPAYEKYVNDLKEDGVLIVDTTNIPEKDVKEPNAIKMPITRIAAEEIGRIITANIVALGAVAAKTGMVKAESVERAILDRVPKGTEELNLKAFRAGFEKAGGIRE